MPGERGYLTVITSVLLFCVSLAIRFYVRNPDALALDEATSVLISQQPLPGLLHALTHDGNPPLYYILLHYWIQFVGNTETLTRALSAVLGAVLPVAIYVAGRFFFCSIDGLFAAVLTLIAPLHVYYSQQVRMYTLAPLCSLFCFYALVTAIQRNSRPSWALFAVAAAACPWVHNYGLFFVASLPAAWWLLERSKRRSALRFACALIGAAVFYLPWVPTLVAQTQSGVAGFIDPLFRSIAIYSVVPQALLNLAVANRFPDYLYGLSAAWSSPPLAVAWCGLALLLSVLALSVRPSPLHAAVLVLTFLPLLLALIFSVTFKPVLLLGRYEIILLPFLSLSLARGIAWLYHKGGIAARAGAIALLTTYVLFASLTLRTYASAPPNRIPERIAATITQHAHAGDRVVVTGLVRAPVQYYLERFGAPVSIRSYPISVADHLGWYDPAQFIASPEILAADADEILRAAHPPTTLFLVEHAASPSIQQINNVLHQRLASTGTTPPTALYAAGPDPNAPPVFLVVKYQYP